MSTNFQCPSCKANLTVSANGKARLEGARSAGPTGRADAPPRASSDLGEAPGGAAAHPPRSAGRTALAVIEGEPRPTFERRAKDAMAQVGQAFDFDTWKRTDARLSLRAMTHPSWADVKLRIGEVVTDE